MLHKRMEICNGKLKYSKNEARHKKLESLRFRNPDLRIYQCILCFYFHLTSSKEFEFGERRRKNQARKMAKKRFHFIPTATIDME